jgi:hypothetical protein
MQSQTGGTSVAIAGSEVNDGRRPDIIAAATLDGTDIV